MKIPYLRAAITVRITSGENSFSGFPKTGRPMRKGSTTQKKCVFTILAKWFNDFLFILFYDPPVGLAQHELHRNLRFFFITFFCDFFIVFFFCCCQLKRSVTLPRTILEVCWVSLVIGTQKNPKSSDWYEYSSIFAHRIFSRCDVLSTDIIIFNWFLMIISHILLSHLTLFVRKNSLQAEALLEKQKISMHEERKLSSHLIAFVTLRFFSAWSIRANWNPFRKFHANYSAGNQKTEACNLHGDSFVSKGNEEAAGLDMTRCNDPIEPMSIFVPGSRKLLHSRVLNFFVSTYEMTKLKWS